MATDCIPQLSFKFASAWCRLRRGARQLRWRGGAAQGDGRPAGRDRDRGRVPAGAAAAGKVQHDVAWSWCASGSSGWPAVTPIATTPRGWPTMPLHKLLLDRDPLTGPALASQATLSRFENAVGALTLIRLGHGLAELVIAQHRARLQGRARRITIDLDPTDDPTHGQQEFTFFHGHYDTWCYLPLLGTVTFDAEAEQYLVLALLRPGNSPAKRGPSAACGTCSARCVPPSPGPGCACAWTAGSPATTCWPSWRPRASSTSSPWPQSPAGQAGPPAAGPGADAGQGQRRDRTPLRRDALCGAHVVAQAPDHHQGRGRVPSRPARPSTIRGSW